MCLVQNYKFKCVAELFLKKRTYKYTIRHVFSQIHISHRKIKFPYRYKAPFQWFFVS